MSEGRRPPKNFEGLVSFLYIVIDFSWVFFDISFFAMILQYIFHSESNTAPILAAC